MPRKQSRTAYERLRGALVVHRGGWECIRQCCACRRVWSPRTGRWRQAPAHLDRYGPVTHTYCPPCAAEELRGRGYTMDQIREIVAS